MSQINVMIINFGFVTLFIQLLKVSAELKGAHYWVSPQWKNNLTWPVSWNRCPVKLMIFGLVWMTWTKSRSSPSLTTSRYSSTSGTLEPQGKIVSNHFVFPVSIRRRFDVDTTLSRSQQRCRNVQTTSYAYWVLTPAWSK